MSCPDWRTPRRNGQGSYGASTSLDNLVRATNLHDSLRLPITPPLHSILGRCCEGSDRPPVEVFNRDLSPRLDRWGDDFFHDLKGSGDVLRVIQMVALPCRVSNSYRTAAVEADMCHREMSGRTWRKVVMA